MAKKEKQETAAAAPETPVSRDTPPAPQAAPRRSRRFLVFYMITLFLAAAVLILLSYLVEARNANQSLTAFSQEQQGNVRSAMEKVQQMQEENARLLEENEQLTQQVQETRSALGRAEQRLGTRQRALAAAEETLAAQERALSRLWWLERCWQRGEQEACRQLLTEMEAAGDRALLPAENPVDPEADSPRTRYDTILENFN